MFSLGGTELLLIAAVVLVLFGPDKIPQFARTVGRFMREFNKYKDIMESTLRTEMYAAEARSEGTEAGAPVSDMEKLEKSAQASREYAAEHSADTLATEGFAAGEPGTPEPGAGTTADAPAHARESVIAVDEEEDEEEEV